MQMNTRPDINRPRDRQNPVNVDPNLDDIMTHAARGSRGQTVCITPDEVGGTFTVGYEGGAMSPHPDVKSALTAALALIREDQGVDRSDEEEYQRGFASQSARSEGDFI